MDDLFWCRRRAPPSGNRSAGVDRGAREIGSAPEASAEPDECRRVVHPSTAHFTFAGDYGRDEAFQKFYVESAKTPRCGRRFAAILRVDEETYQRRLLRGGPSRRRPESDHDRTQYRYNPGRGSPSPVPRFFRRRRDHGIADGTDGAARGRLARPDDRTGSAHHRRGGVDPGRHPAIGRSGPIEG